MREENDLLKNRIAALEAQLSGDTGPVKRTRKKAEAEE
jgi:BMFP domain-containing protein YqiC